MNEFIILGDETRKDPDNKQAETQDISRLATDFYEDLCSGGFSRMTLFETRDELQRTRFVIYLRKSPSVGIPQRGKDIGESFSELALALRPNLFLDLYYDLSEDDRQNLEGNKEDIKLRYGTEDHQAEAKLLWVENLPEGGDCMKEQEIPEKKIELISVHIDPETQEDPGSCLLCGSDMDNVPLEYEFEDDQVVVRNSEPVPGHRCGFCNAEYYDSSTTLRLFQETLPKLRRFSDRRAALAESIKSLTKALA